MSANTVATTTSASADLQQQKKKPLVRVFLDVDGTLYRYGDTLFHHDFQANARRLFPAMLGDESLVAYHHQHNHPQHSHSSCGQNKKEESVSSDKKNDGETDEAALVDAEAIHLHDLYHNTYGNPLVGIMKHHCVCPTTTTTIAASAAVDSSAEGENSTATAKTSATTDCGGNSTDADTTKPLATAPLRPLPSMEELQKCFHDFITVDYRRIQPNPTLESMLRAMKTEDGYDMWLFTNANARHANECTKELGVKHLFVEDIAADSGADNHANGEKATTSNDENRNKDDEAMMSGGGAKFFKCVDAFDQWGLPETPIADIGNKPFPIGYERADKKASVVSASLKSNTSMQSVRDSGSEIDSLNSPLSPATGAAAEAGVVAAKKDDEVIRVMVEDALVNLRSPNAMGWITVWIADGRKLPSSSEDPLADIKPTIVIERIEDLREALRPVVEARIASSVAAQQQ